MTVKFSVGYRIMPPGEPLMAEIIEEFRHAVSEVYFPWVEMASGRAPLKSEDREILLADLREFRRMNLRLNLVLNASCYGAGSFSVAFADQVRGVLRFLDGQGLVDSVTTMSPLIANIAKSEFPHIKTRASVNMRLGTVDAFEYVAPLFDGYNMQRDFQRDLARIAQLKTWCDNNGKTLHMLANSGCMTFCAVQTFHDNLVAHEAEIDHAHCVKGHIPGSCWEYFRKPPHHARLLANTWIRPEDVRHYEQFVPELKLATRMHSKPRKVIKAYADGRYRGNLLELFEPSHASLIAPAVIDNTRFPADWFEQITSPKSPEAQAAYYTQVYEQVALNVADWGIPAQTQ